MFADYRNAILSKLAALRANHGIALRLVNPTPANIKKECLAVCEARFQKSDLRALNSFFGAANDQKEVLHRIERFDIDKFKPVVSYLKGKTQDPSELVVELVAWLIDFSPRPFELGLQYVVESPANKTAGREPGPSPLLVVERPTEQPEDDVEEDELTNVRTSGKAPGAPPARRRRTVPLMLAGASALTIGLVGLWQSPFYSKKPIDYGASGSASCMYWTGDHYEPVNCNQKMGDTLVVAMDPARLSGFRKILQPDTITLSSIGHVWYARFDNRIEYYTGNGNHPERFNVKLHPITAYMINKHVRISQ